MASTNIHLPRLVKRYRAARSLHKYAFLAALTDRKLSVEVVAVRCDTAQSRSLRHVYGRKASASYEWVAPNFFHLLKVPVLAGREFGWQDDEGAPGKVVLNRQLAELLPNEDPIGRKVDFSPPETRRRGKADENGLTIVGVVQDAALWRRQDPYPMAIYLSPMQKGDPGGLVFIRAAINPMVTADISERTVRAMGYQLSIRTQPLEER